MSIYIFLAICVITVIFSVFIFYRGKKQLQQKIEALSIQLNDYENLLSGMPHLLCYWYEGSRFVTCSKDLRKLLRFDEEEIIRVDQWISRLSDGPFSPFQKSMNHLMEFGGDFYLQLTLWHGDVHVGIHGRKIKLAPGAFQTHIIVLAFTHISQFVQEHQIFVEQKHKTDVLKGVANQAPMMLWARNSQGRIVYCNQQYASFLNTTVERVIAENKELLSPAPGFEGTYSLSKKVSAHHHHTNARTYAVWEGERKWLEIGETWLGIDGAKSVGYALDYTEVSDAENSLQRTARANHDMMELLSTAMCVYGTDTRLVDFNSAYIKIFEFDESFLATKPTLSEVLDDLRERRKISEGADFPAYKRSRMSLFHNMFSPIHDTLHQPNGYTLRMVISPHPYGGIFYLFDDVSEQTKLEHNYQSLNATYRHVVENLKDSLVIFGADHRVRMVNHGFKAAFAECEAELGKHIGDILRALKPSDTWLNELQQHINNRTANQYYAAPVGYQYLPLPDGSHLIKLFRIN